MNKVRLTWKDITKDSHKLAERCMIESGGRPWNGIVAIARGGLIPAAIVAQSFDGVPIYSVTAVTYTGQDKAPSTKLLNLVQLKNGGDGYLFIDDIVDSGETTKRFADLYPKATFASLYAKTERFKPIGPYVRDFEWTIWVEFPWER